MWASVKWIPESHDKVAEIRAFDDDQKYGAPYRWCCIAVLVAPKTVELRLVSKGPPSGCKKAVSKALRDSGVTHWRWERRKEKRFKVVYKEIPDYKFLDESSDGV